MDMPPSRYRVVERGRRLIVVDSHTGAPVTGLHVEDQARIDALKQRLEAPAAAPRRDPPPRPSTGQDRPQAPPSPPPASGPPGLGDPSILTTQPWFDNKAPRRVRIAESNSTKAAVVAVALLFAVGTLFVMFDWPGLVVAAVIFLNVRKAILAGITSWIDTLEQV